jgi:two-component sensor histidine kinase
MERGPIFKRIFYSSGFMAAIPAILIILFLPTFGTKYKLQIEQVDRNLSNYVYADINSDSISEVFHTGKGIPYFYIVVQDNNLHVYDQWNFKDSLDIDLSDFFFGNYDNDLFKEIYAFTYIRDSLFLNINEFFDSSGLKSDRLYITNICSIKGKVTSTVFPAGFYDVDGDGKSELFFSIQTGFGLKPRQFYSYDIARNKLNVSEFAGIAVQTPYMYDIDGDGRPDFFGLTGASGNYKTPVSFSDKSSWLMVLDDQLRYKFPPVEFPGLTNVLRAMPYTDANFTGFVLSHTTGSADSSVAKPKIMIYSSEGEKIRERTYIDYGFQKYTTSSVLRNKGKDRIYIFGSNLLEVDLNLGILNRAKIPFNGEYNHYFTDLDFDGVNEVALISYNDDKMVVYNANLKKLAESKILSTYKTFRFSHYSTRDHVNKTFIEDVTDGYFINLKRNNYYFLGYSIYPGIYLVCLLFIVLIKRINTLQVVQKESLNRRLVTLQLQGIKSQLDPHFTFNTLNSIASLIYLEDREVAYDYMNKFTQLLRSLINDAEKIYRTLAEELDFVTTYLDLEKLRFGEKFNYEIIIDDKINRQIKVPKLVLQTFAENAIKHGLMSCVGVGFLQIKARKIDDYLVLSIEDNGIGRARAEGMSLSTGKGLKLTGEFYDILNQINKRPIKHSIIDLYNESGESSGTRVEVWVPVE